MKKIVLALLTITVALCAVEWEVEQVITGEMPLIALDSEGYARVLFLAYPGLKVGSNVTGEWEIKDVVELEKILPYYGLAVNSKGNAVVVFQDIIDWDLGYDLFMATDKSGEFETTNLTNYPEWQYRPVITIDQQDVVHMVYLKMVDWYEEIDQIFYAKIDNGDFTSAEQVTDNAFSMYGYFEISKDVVVEKNQDPHVFYLGEDTLIWHASKTGNNPWLKETISAHSGYDPLAAIDGSNNIHIAYASDYYRESDDLRCICYLTNKNGSWEDTIAFGDAAANWHPDISVDLSGNPHIIWYHYAFYPNIYYTCEDNGGWAHDSITTTQSHEYFGYGHSFAVDSEGYGHLVYEDEDDEQIYYAKSKAPLAVSEKQLETSSNLLEIRGTTVRFTLAQTSPVTLNLYDAVGRHVDHLASGTYPAGEHAVPINSTGLAAGVYFIRAEIAGQSANAKFMLTH